MAEAWLNHLYGEMFEAESAGLEAGTLNPLAVAAMKEVGIDISSNQTRDAFEVYKSGKIFSYVVTVCDEASAERCPVFPGITRRMHWSFPDPAALVGTEAEKIEMVRQIRDSIKRKIQGWVGELTNLQSGHPERAM
jgi:arsenate reductase